MTVIFFFGPFVPQLRSPDHPRHLKKHFFHFFDFFFQHLLPTSSIFFYILLSSSTTMPPRLSNRFTEYVYLHICIYIYIYIHIRIYTYTYIYIYICIHIYIYMYTCIHIYTHISFFIIFLYLLIKNWGDAGHLARLSMLRIPPHPLIHPNRACRRGIF